MVTFLDTFIASWLGFRIPSYQDVLARFIFKIPVTAATNVTFKWYSRYTDPVQSGRSPNKVSARRTPSPHERGTLRGTTKVYLSTTRCMFEETPSGCMATFPSDDMVASAAPNRPQTKIYTAYYIRKKSPRVICGNKKVVHKLTSVQV